MVKDNFDKNVKTSKVKISRESKIIFIAVPTIFGYDNQDKVSLRNGDNLEIDVPLGTHEFFVRSNQADRPAKLSAKVEEGKSLCFVINPEPKPVIKFIIFPIFWFTHTFRIEQEESLCR